MKLKSCLLIVLLILILLILWILRGCQTDPAPQPGPEPEPSACVGVQTYTRNPALFIEEALNPGPGTPQPVTDQLVISDTGTIGDLDVNMTVFLPEYGELILDLTSPSGTTVRFMSTEGGPGDGMDNVTFNDEAAGLPPNFVVNGTCLVNESYQPAPDVFSAFDGESITGTWTLTVADAFVGDAVDCDCDGFVLGPPCPRTLDEWKLIIDCGSQSVSAR